MYNDLFRIGSLTIHSYGVMISIGILFAILLATKRTKSKGLNTDHVLNIIILCMVFGFLGAKILYCIVELPTFLENPMSFFSGSGFVVYGGIIGGLIAAILYCRIKKINFLNYFDLMIPSVALAQGFGRIGCFLAGCCYGKETNSFFGVTFHNSEIAPNGVKLIPTQLFSSAGDFLIMAILLVYAKKERKAGKVGAVYLILYSIGRFIIEYFRNDYRGNVGGFLSTSQFISLIIIIAGGLFLLLDTVKFKKVKHNNT
ncbi:prolipoprotein diacylglyceryl transferase [Paludicola sp. MB14-C6]|uniref:prolipoprotein diacylglyceryl transferase n=1 Tax=Paludihabitans sp. MB14-C6 TaxID=3070656 RepID=UPI0027DE3E1F|nr:prolipoprotein diacylglyceryl transferase [Paludicola sp. MB14-C6]WMJ23129.1 prolipoprotein diacylglyceryl transferase [Paludicola sp. MB14-C6]